MASMTTFGAGAMFEEPVIAAYLAAVSSAWALIETVAADFMAYLISEPYMTPENRAIDPLGKRLYGQLPTFRQRWTVLGMILDTRLNDSEQKRFKARRKALDNELRAVSEIRNTLVHSAYGHQHGHSGTLVRSTPYLLFEEMAWEPELIDADRLKADVRRIDSARKQLQRFVSDVQERNTANPPTTQ